MGSRGRAVGKAGNDRLQLSPRKSYLGCPSVKLLGQRVDGLRLTTAGDKQAISDLAFLHTLKELEIYLGMTKCLRYYVPWYVFDVDTL